ncbi:MAG: hypothetical protein RJA52_1506 [Bacteroidota bacterium]
MWGYYKYLKTIVQKIETKYFEHTDLILSKQELCLNIPAKANYQKWLFERGLDQFIEKAPIPEKPMLVIPQAHSKINNPPGLEDFLTTALILAKSGPTLYMPDNIPIFSESRLNRAIILIEINIEKYYELD